MVPGAAGANQVAIIFMAGGYTPARKKPVRKRRPRARTNHGLASSKPVAPAASKAQAVKYQREGTTSAKFSSAAAAVPATKPSCTTVVSQLASATESPQTRCSSGDTALAVNQSDIPSNSAIASKPSTDQANLL